MQSKPSSYIGNPAEDGIRAAKAENRARAAAAEKADATFLKIAKEHLRLETLETRNSDGLDFSDQAVWHIKAALEAAYEAGKTAK